MNVRGTTMAKAKSELHQYMAKQLERDIADIQLYTAELKICMKVIQRLQAEEAAKNIKPDGLTDPFLLAKVKEAESNATRAIRIINELLGPDAKVSDSSDPRIIEQRDPQFFSNPPFFKPVPQGELSSECKPHGGKLTKEERSAIAKEAAKKRWAKLKKHES